MPDNIRTQQTIEPVHVRADYPQIPGSTKSSEPQILASDPAGSAKPEQAPQPVLAAALSQKPQPKSKERSQKPRSGVGAAVTATVIIVLGLAALAVFAYIKTKK
jgi:hypothetical protein